LPTKAAAKRVHEAFGKNKGVDANILKWVRQQLALPSEMDHLKHLKG